MKKNYSPYRERFAWWTHPWLIVIAVGEIGFGVFSFVWTYSFLNLASALAIGGIFCVLPFITARYFKEGLIDPNYSVDEKVIEKTRRHIADERARASSEFRQAEVTALKEGRKTPVLEKLSHDPARWKIHDFYRDVASMEIDPIAREFLVRIRIGPIEFGGEEAERRRKKFLSKTFEFCAALAKERELGAFLDYFETCVLEVYSVTEDQAGRERPLAILSMLFRKASFGILIASGGSIDMTSIGDVRFDAGKAIAPHRGMP